MSNEIPKGIATLNKATKDGAMIKALAANHGATNIQFASARSLRFDLPAGKALDKINRVKITAREDGTVDIRLIEVIEHDLIGGVQPDAVAVTLSKFLGFEI